ncbi:DNA-3-methyladenine glycosylase I [Chlorobium sp.]
MKRCDWAASSLPEIAYHDEEWGLPVHDDRKQVNC